MTRPGVGTARRGRAGTVPRSPASPGQPASRAGRAGRYHRARRPVINTLCPSALPRPRQSDAEASGESSLVYADDALVVVDKPAGLLSVPGRGETGREHLVARVQRRFADALVVHRLDQATSGLVVFARGTAMQRALSKAFAARLVTKRYEALVQGIVEADEGAIDLPLAADWPHRPRQRVDPLRGKPSLTRWRVLGRDAALARTRLQLEPVTGRSHQLRVHLLAIGHPIVGDALYAPEWPAPRLMLHACVLALPHPANGSTLTVHSAVPFEL